MLGGDSWNLPVEVRSFPPNGRCVLSLGAKDALAVLSPPVKLSPLMRWLDFLAQGTSVDVIVLTDSDPGCVERCRAKLGATHPGIPAEHASVTQPPDGARRFSRVLCVQVLHGCETPGAIRTAVAELARVLRPGGRAVVVTVVEMVHLAEIGGGTRHGQDAPR